MDFGLSDTQTLLRDSIRDFLRRQIPIDRVRSVMASPAGHDPDLVAGLAHLGVSQILIPEEMGGAGLGLLDAVVAAQELGRCATPLSFHSAWVMAPLLLQAAGSEEQRRRWLPDLARGEVLLTFIPAAPATRGGRLTGSVPFVADGQVAHAFIVEESAGSLHLLPRRSPGISVHPLETVDATRRVAEVTFEDVALTAETRMTGSDDPALPTLPAIVDRVVDAGRIALAADALGAGQTALEMAVSYSLERHQFGRPIGSFQAVKHMCAEMVAELDPVQSLLWYAAYAWDRQQDDSLYLAPLLKAHATEVATRAVATATEVFGGMGFTDECDLHIWFKRAGYDRQMLGGPTLLRQKAAQLQF